MMFIDVVSPAQAVETAAQLVIARGAVSSPRGQETLEVTNPTIRVAAPWHMPYELEGRDLRPFIGAMEALQLVGQTSVPEQMVAGSKPFGQFTDHGVFHGAYGIRVHGRLGPLVDLLQKDQDTRQAVLTIFDSARDLGAQVADVPCTQAIHFMIRDGALCVRTTMRSNDVWLGLPYDLVQFIALQGAVAAALGLPMGWYAHSVGSMHLYRRDVKKAGLLRANSSVRPYSPMPLWRQGTIGDISARARGILAGRLEAPDQDLLPTRFERWLFESATGWSL